MAHVVRAWRASRTIRFLVLIVVLGTTTQVILSRGAGAVQNGAARQTKIIGSDRLVSVEPLGETDGAEICIPEPVASNPELIASLQQENLPAARRLMASARQQQSGAPGARAATVPASIPGRPSDALRLDVAKRQPASTVRDPRNAFASLVVDAARNEVIFAEENNFSVLVYDRMENTPPRAALSEPKRIIHGENTYLEFACGVYVDPPTGDVYVINNDTLNWMTVWDRNAKGNVKPTRKLHTPMATFGLAADEENQEMLMTVQDDHAVVTFKKNAKDLEGPVRLLQGPKTRMADPHGIAVDPKTGLIYVTNWGTVNERESGGPPRFGHALWPIGRNNNIPGTGRFELPSITVYRKDASGDVAPLRVIQGPKTGLDWPTSIAVHPDRGELFVANDTADTVTIYRTTDNGDVAPIRVLKGPKSLIKNPTGVALDLKNNELWVANFGSHAATVFPVDATGDPTPKRVIRSGRPEEGAPMLGNPHTLAYDSKRDEILVSN
jgi:DNA-binding beta-propeller fold protein YncE